MYGDFGVRANGRGVAGFCGEWVAPALDGSIRGGMLSIASDGRLAHYGANV